nr:MAG TPA: hypothetical protein [Caudoviricetes sp.]
MFKVLLVMPVSFDKSRRVFSFSIRRSYISNFTIILYASKYFVIRF